MWKGDKPDLKNLRLFGCTAYAKILGPLKKLDDRSKKFKFVGYAPQGYRLWDADKRKIIISRDVRFETIIENEKETKSQMRDIQGETEEESEEEEKEAEEDRREETREIEEEEEEDSLDEEIILEISSDDEDTEERIQDKQEMDTTEQLRRSKREKRIPERYGNHRILMTYQQAITGPDKAKWKQAIQREKDSLKKNNTWKIVDREEAGKKRI